MARLLLKAIASGEISANKFTLFKSGRCRCFRTAEIRRQISSLWPELKAISGPKREKIDHLQARLDAHWLAAADLPNGRRRFNQSCATCHILFGQGTKIGPDLTGVQRTVPRYLLENIVDPSAIVAADYRMSTVVLTDGRVLNAIVNDQGGPTVIVQTPTDRLVVSRGDIEEIRKSNASLMPEGLLDVLPGHGGPRPDRLSHVAGPSPASRSNDEEAKRPAVIRCTVSTESAAAMRHLYETPQTARSLAGCRLT